MDRPPRHEDAGAADTSMISNSSPYQPTTEPVSDRTTICAGFILDTQYVKSLAGILKSVEILLCIIVLICLSSGVCAGTCSGISFLKTVAIWGMVYTILMYFFYASTLVNTITIINWPLSDLLGSAVDSLLFLIASIVQAAHLGNAGNAAGFVFGFINAAAYALSARFAYRAYLVDRHKRRSHVTHIAGVVG